MAVKIRLRRMGQRNRPFYRVVVADSRTSNNGRFIETIGWYNPIADGHNHSLKMDRYDYWKSVGAIPSNSVISIVKREKLVAEGKEIPNSHKVIINETAKPKSAAVEEPVEEKAEAPAEEAAAPAEEAKAPAEEAEAPAEEAAAPAEEATE